ncbi:hypothetical protein HYU06_05155 [Candidatus Woesearchaeota archaeon]|nr:hypothetical protein [Candidatus Woesearchaeota archaeon]
MAKGIRIKKIFNVIVLMVIVTLLFTSVTNAKTYKIKLLAVAEQQGNFTGKMADLFLELNPGSGRVFMDTLPLTKIDTQISTRFANQIACNYIDADCSIYDFIYTIRAESSIIGGPSAGAAIAVLTVSALQNLDPREDIAMTGTINSGGIIGPVGAVKQKIEAAAKNKISKVLIAKGAALYDEIDEIRLVQEIAIEEDNNINNNDNTNNDDDNEGNNNTTTNITAIINNQTDNPADNKTLDLKGFSKELSVELVEVATLDDALVEFTGRRFFEDYGNIVIDESYLDTMKEIANGICSRTRELYDKVSEYQNVTSINQGKFEFAKNLSLQALTAFENKSYYSAASLCFGANVQLNTILNILRNITKDSALEQVKVIESSIEELRKRIDNTKKRTITDLQASIIVKERLAEATELLEKIKESIKNNKTDFGDLLSFSTERVYSAVSWSHFLNKPGKAVNLDNDRIKKACEQKINEAEERINYIGLMFPQLIGESYADLEAGKQELARKNFEQCLQKASLAKAQADSVLSLIGISEQHFDGLLDNRVTVARNQIVKSANKGTFPILGYSYFEYANTLRKQDKYSALIYLQYALELSDLGIYFPAVKEKNYANFTNFNFRLDENKKAYYMKYAYLSAGIVIGILVGIIIALVAKKNSSSNKNRRKQTKR